MNAIALAPADARYPARLRERLGDAAPAQLTTLGNLDLLTLPKTGLFCSARCPGHVILPAYDQTARWRDAGRMRRRRKHTSGLVTFDKKAERNRP